jgi:GTP-binding protein Era
VSVEIDEYREDQDPVYIRATILVERDSQKGMVIGRAGRTVKSIGQAARGAIETLLDQRVYLDLRVKVLPKWGKSPQHLRRLGLPVPESRT